ncbi:MAG: nitroreductase [Bacteroidetes bacterium]|nr:nitroreductase [Bacteroidota bacterium]
MNTVIRNRRSIFPRQFTGETIPRALLLQLLENANWAPTHRHTEPWRFHVIQGEARERLGQFLAEAYRANTPESEFSAAKYEKTLRQPMQASAVIAIGMQRDLQERVPEWEEIAAVACAVQNLWLSATALGLAGYWSTPKAMLGTPAFLATAPGERCLGLFYLGTWIPEAAPGKRSPIDEKVRWIGSNCTR